MGDEKDSSGLIIGIIIGAFIALVLLSRKTQTVSAQSVQPIQQQAQQYNWQPMDIPRVDDIKHHIVQPPVIQVQQDPQLIKALSELQKTNSQLEQTASKLQELQETVSKLKQDSMSQPQQIIIQQPAIQQPVYQPPHVIVQQQPDRQPPHIVQPIQTPQTAQPIQEQQIYKNSEKWQIVRGKDGRIKSLDIVRDVKKSG